MKRWQRLALAAALIAVAGFAYWKLAIPVHRVPIRSELVMLGDLDGDHRWSTGDLAGLERFLERPYPGGSELAWRLDMNRNGLVDEEDVRILPRLVEAGRLPWPELLREVSGHLKVDLGLDYDFEKLGPPRNLTRLENYLERAEWQYYKSTAREEDLRQLVAYAQHDPRYLHAVSRTTRKLKDPGVENHNLPMVLLFREALRIPYAWIKSIPREKLPGALALDNFLLPGNKEDGSDKSRHWNVFGGICLYKSPQEALDLALKREMQDLREGGYSKQELREFFRDLIVDVNGMYHVMAVKPPTEEH